MVATTSMRSLTRVRLGQRLRVGQHAAGLFRAGHVTGSLVRAHDTEHPDGRAVGSAEDPAADIDPSHAAVRRHDAMLGDEVTVVVERRLQGLGHLTRVLGMHQVPERRAGALQLARFATEDAAQPVVPVQPVVDDVPVEAPQGGRGHRELDPSPVDVVGRLGRQRTRLP